MRCSVVAVDGVLQQVVVAYAAHKLVQRSCADVVIAVNECEVVTLRLADARVAGTAQAAVGLVDDLDARVFPCPFLTELRAGVGRAVIDQHHFEVAERLTHNALQAAPEGGFCAIDGYDDAQFHATKVRKYLQLRNKKRNFAFLFKEK